MAFRNPSVDEARLLDFLVQASEDSLPSVCKKGILVEEMSDGGMGSLRLRPGIEPGE